MVSGQPQREEERDRAESGISSGGVPPKDESGADADTGSTNLETIQAELAEAMREKDQFKRLLQRTQADFINFRNRTDEDVASARKAGTRSLALRIIEVLDLFDAALAADTSDTVDRNWLAGFQGIRKLIIADLSAEGIERFKTQGEKFDPRRHEALIVTPTTEFEPSTVIKDVWPGYMFKGEVIRPAKVEVSAAPPDDAGAKADTSN